jgi:hypothetical protein
MNYLFIQDSVDNNTPILLIFHYILITMEIYG